MPTIRFDRKPPVPTVEWYRDPSGQMSAGYWTHEGGVIEVDYTEHEFVLLLAGRVRLTDQEGAVDEYGMGDGFVIPAGFKGTWETLKPVRKWYVTFEPKG